MLDSSQLLLSGVILLLQGHHLLLQVHTSEIRLEILRKLRGDLLILLQQVDDDDQHEVNEKNSSLHNMLLRLWQALGGVPACPFEKKVMDTAIQLTVELAQVLTAISLGNSVLFSLIIEITRHLATFALPTAKLLERWFAVDVLRSNQCHNFGV
jgi:hypothetical protein